MNKPSTTTKITKVLSSKLRVDNYQRPLNESRVTAIVKAFNPDLVNYIKCLSNVSPMQIIRNGNLISDYGKSKYTSQIVKIYNKGMQKKLVSSH